MQEVRLRTGIWYNDRSIRLTFPDFWDIVTYWPDTPPPLTDEDILKKINSPIGQPLLHKLALGKKRPLIVVDDLSRPTPIFKIMPFLLEQFKVAGIPYSDIRIIVATGTHGSQNENALANKLGKDAMESCQVIIHDDKNGTKFIGKTSFGTPVYVNKELLKSDFIIGISGVYPQHTTGFGGGSKLALGILGRKSIRYMHYSHKSVGGTYDINNDFRKDVTEIAQMVGLKTMYTLHINAYLEIVNLMCGDHFIYYPQAAQFSKQRYSPPLPVDADVVIANAYPFDTSFTFMRKAYRPLDFALRKATKVMIASNHEGIGTHGLFQHMKPPRFMEYRMLYRRISTMEPKVIFSKILKHVTLQKKTKETVSQKNYAIPVNADRLWLYRPVANAASIPPIDGITIIPSWDEIIAAIEREQTSNKKKIKVRIYPCAPLQCLDAAENNVSDSLKNTLFL